MAGLCPGDQVGALPGRDKVDQFLAGDRLALGMLLPFLDRAHLRGAAAGFDHRDFKFPAAQPATARAIASLSECVPRTRCAAAR